MTYYRPLTERQLLVLRHGARLSYETTIRYKNGRRLRGSFEVWILNAEPFPDVSTQVYALMRRRMVRVDRLLKMAVPMLTPSHISKFRPPGKWIAFPRRGSKHFPEG